MAFGGFNKTENAPLAEINMIPLVDVMLVLLVIFIITAPVITHSISIDMPKAAVAANPEKPDSVTLSIDARGNYFWNDAPLKSADLLDRMQQAAAANPNVEINLRADKKTDYEILAKVMATARNSGITKIGFVLEPAK
jgi:biopolymer transport protein ExbD